MEQDQQTIDARDLLWRLRRYTWLLVLPPVVAICAASVYYTTSPIVYEATVVVSPGEANVGGEIRSMVGVDRGRSDTGNQLVLVDRSVHSRQFLIDVMNRLGLTQDASVESAAVAAARRYPGVPVSEFAARIASARLASRIRVTPADGNCVNITTSGGTAESAQRLAGTISDLLIAGNLRSSLEREQERGKFSRDQMAVYQERLRQQQDALQAFQEALLHRSLASTPVNKDNVDKARAIVSATEQEIGQTRDRVAVAKSQWNDALPGEIPATLSSPTSDELERRLRDAEIQAALAALSSTAAPVAGAPMQAPSGQQSGVVTLRQSLFLEFQNLAATTLPKDVPDIARSAAVGLATDRAILSSLNAKRDRMNGYINQFVTGVERSPRDQMELTRLTNAVKSTEGLLAALGSEAQSSRISEALTSSTMGMRLVVLDPPQLPLHPASPNPIRIFGAALLLGPMISIGLVLVLEKVTVVINSVEQAEQELGTRVLGTVPKIQGWVRRGSYLARHWAAVSTVVVLLLTGLFLGLNATVPSARPHQATGASANSR
jgi:uncharacterized protein involved in exopolysaccharide biosynthesis